MFGIVRGPIVGWVAAETVGALVAAVVLFAIFVRIQSTKHDPLMRLGIWRAPNLAAANISVALLGAAWIPTWFFLNLYLQQVLSFGAFDGGVALVPMTLAIMVLMVGVTGRLVSAFGFKRPLVAGLLILAGGVAWLGLTPADGSYIANILPATLVAATGMSLAYIPAMLAALAGARPEEGGLAAGIVNTTYQGGSALGLAVITAIATANGFGSQGSTIEGFGPAFAGAALIALAGAGIALVALRTPSTTSAAPTPEGSPHVAGV